MLRYANIFLLMLVCTVATAHTKLTPEIRHFISLNGDLGYAALLHNIPNHPSSTGINTNIGVAYRLYYNRFVLSVGAEGAYQLNANQIEDRDFTIPMKDTEGEAFDMHVLVAQSQDRTHMVNLNIPVLLGGEWGRFYFAAGPKVAINVYGAAMSKALYTTYGEYNLYYDDFHDMPNHQFVTDNTMQSGTLPMKWNLNILAHAEIGVRLGKIDNRSRSAKNNIRMYIGAYADCGILNLVSGKYAYPIFDYHETEDQGVQFYVQPLMRSNLTNGAIVRNLNVGIKYTIAFEILQPGKSYKYEHKKTKQLKRNRGGNQLIY